MEVYTRLGSSVWIWLLQSDADIDADRTDRDGTIQREDLVLVLPNGNHDTGHLPDQRKERE